MKQFWSQSYAPWLICLVLLIGVYEASVHTKLWEAVVGGYLP